ncbi:MAG: MFS transporter, partial [Gammaproteobacteria bacterium]|nr:MFS transporter [Gammaproteobacteria bacterium]
MLSRDFRLLFLTRFLRLFAYGLLSVVLVLYLAALGLGTVAIGTLLTLTLLGDTALALLLTTRADRWGRRRTLVLSAVLMTLGAAVVGVSHSFPLLLLAMTLGVISPSGNEVGPFLPIEQA